VPDWPKPLADAADGVKHDGWTWGSVGAVYAETPDRIWIAQRGELPLPPGAKPWTPYAMLQPTRGNADRQRRRSQRDVRRGPKRGWERRYHHVVFVVDRNGDMVQWWNDVDKIFEGRCGTRAAQDQDEPLRRREARLDHRRPAPHDLQVHLRREAGDVRLGPRVSAGRDGGKLFDRPTDIAWLPDGTFFISDGYGGTRVAKFDKDGTSSWTGARRRRTRAIPGPNEFNTVHSIQISNDRRLFVVDRTHRRFQVFDENGKYLDMFATGAASSPYTHLITTDQYLWFADGGTNRIVKYDLGGHYLYGWGIAGKLPGQFTGPHSMTTDQDGNLYLAEVFNGRVQKFRPKAGADPAKLVGQELRYKATSQTDSDQTPKTASGDDPSASPGADWRRVLTTGRGADASASLHRAPWRSSARSAETACPFRREVVRAGSDEQSASSANLSGHGRLSASTPHDRSRQRSLLRWNVHLSQRHRQSAVDVPQHLVRRHAAPPRRGESRRRLRIRSMICDRKAVVMQSPASAFVLPTRSDCS
jgi:hypothetical protein